MYTEDTLSNKIKSFLTFGFIPLLIFALVMAVPFFVGVYMTFTDSAGGTITADFSGFANYAAAFNDPLFWDSMLLTLKYVFFSLVLTNVLAFLLALLVTSGMKGQNFFRLGFFTPNLIGGIILGFVWQFVFSRVMVYFGKELDIGLLSSSWLGDPQKALWALIIVGVWQNAGYMMLIYIAGIQGVDKSLLEAASLDGASWWGQLLRVKIPLMASAFTISLFLTLQRSFMVYDTNLSLTSGGPYRSTEMIAMHVYNEAFKFQHFGVGQAKAIVLFVIVAAIALLQVGAMKRLEVES
ncbi:MULTISPECIES: carbohydrate ABC transporter permease [Cohnella]|uniref:carbohydrate ABC transporter permease n=1 Tax=Cohnella TaxID=329857 RepID=UPI0009BA83EC|nr:sugar ABC transporter permease [Cohnella massiliensis]MBN2984688.1 sugar ABC transporter permease [Cohnella algarum]